jgi:hypothetical protein
MTMTVILLLALAITVTNAALSTPVQRKYVKTMLALDVWPTTVFKTVVFNRVPSVSLSVVYSYTYISVVCKQSGIANNYILQHMSNNLISCEKS